MRFYGLNLWIVISASLVFTASGCERKVQDGDESYRGNESPDACSLIGVTAPVLGPEKYERFTGKPSLERTNFQIPTNGELCVMVTNGLHDPPHGHRVSAAWIRIDGTVVVGPDPFSQVTAGIKQAFPIKAGDHELSVELASKPGSFLTVEIRLLAEDSDPPEVVIEPANGSTMSTDMPLVRIGYTDA